MAKTGKGGGTVSKEKLDFNKHSEVHEVVPRDVFGAPTGKRFEYQYEQTAKACLELLESDEKTCIFCEWHDDFVVEKVGGATPTVMYAFCQVKTRDGERGPWEIWDLFGINKKKASSAQKVNDSFIFKLLRHFIDFGKSCEQILFVTNCAIDKELANFVNALESSTTTSSLESENKKIFDNIFRAYSQLIDELTEDDLLGLLKKLNIIAEDVPLKKSKQVFQSELMEKIYNMSEINLQHTEALKIGRELLSLVRSKAHAELKIRISKNELRKIKGVELSEVLQLLSLSKDAYDILKSGGDKDALKKLSRLQRILKKSDPTISDSLISEFCDLKVAWDSWKRQARHDDAARSDLIALQTEARNLLNEWTADTIKVVDIPSRAQNLMVRFSKSFPVAQPLTKELVFGCVLALAVED